MKNQVENKSYKYLIDGSKFKPCELADDICYHEPEIPNEPKVTNKIYVVTKDNQEIYRYNGRYHEPNGEQYIKSEVQDIIGAKCTPTMKNNVISCVKDNKELWINRDDFNKDKNLINLKNGIYNIKTKEFNKHTPRHLFTYEIPVDYGPNAKCPKIMKFFKEVLSPEDILVIQELFGYCLYPSYQIEKAFIFLGDGANGKSTLLNLLTRFLGKNNISSVPLQVIGKDKFAASDLYGKLANICADIPNTALNNTSLFKMLTGQDSIRAEKKFKDPFNFYNIAKHIFSANQIPPSPADQSDAFFRRWILINFPNRFIGSKCDRNILEKITVFPEMSGLLNWALEGLKRLLEKKEFSRYTSIDEVREYWNKSSNLIAEFIYENIEQDDNGVETKDEVYNRYKQFAREKKYPTIASNVFSRKLKESIGFKISEGQLHNGKKTWKGIKLKKKKKEGLQQYIEEQTVQTI
jgi:putative DNA primase/helicase